MRSTQRRAVVSLSGGKDSMLALHRAREQGLSIDALLCVLDETGLRSRSHGIPRALIETQARALGLPCVLPSASWQNYESVFVRTLRELAAQGFDEAVFGDIDLDPHRDREERVCQAAGP